jgi:predicted CxxxxCH...CXXCH cytochrome family protein
MLALAACATERALPDASPTTGVHPSGILDEGSDNFHGKELARRGWDLGLCAKCHGDDFRGGTSGATCTTCHPAGPDACATCHREGEMSGAHALHAAAGESCGECHVVPARWDAPGHVLHDPPPAEVVFGARAAQTLDPADRAGPPAYTAGTCANVYCHGDVLHAPGGTATQPSWTAPPVGGCGTCHGAPPPSHAQDGCDTCHRDAPHLDGMLQVGGGCTGCHGDATSPAPPRDLAGNLFTTAIGVGAHRAHLGSRLSSPIACAECHVVPAAIGDPGHIDSPLPAEVFPTGAGTLARRDGATPVWDRQTASCATTYCHGGGTRLAGDTSPGRLVAPVWTQGGQVFCGSCHGIPPSNHAPMTLGDCVSCHSRSVDAFGAIVFDGGTSRHLDGVVDVD